MISQRAREILEVCKAEGAYGKHTTLEEEDRVYDIWTGMERSSSLKEVLTLIA